MKEKERLIFSINRFDHYYDSINNKASVLLSIAALANGGYLALLNSGLINFRELGVASFLFGVVLILGVVDLILLLQTIAPFTSKSGSSIFYFGDISKRNRKEFKKLSRKISDKRVMSDLQNQVHSLASGLHKKFTKLRMAAWLFLAQVVLIGIVIIIINI